MSHDQMATLYETMISLNSDNRYTTSVMLKCKLTLYKELKLQNSKILDSDISTMECWKL